MRTKEDVIRRFQCPGCVLRGDKDCRSLSETHHGDFNCRNFSSGVQRLGRHILEAMPLHFDLVKHTFRFWLNGTRPNWDDFDVPVWALEKDGFLFVHTYEPTTGDTYIDTIEHGSMDMVPKAINVGE